jgi:hypothetical protein
LIQGLAAGLEEAETIDGLRTVGNVAADGRVARTLLESDVNRLAATHPNLHRSM